ncbi:thiol-disulfide isomerase/thioredoxin [Aeromicrobium panaciterrae]|uniref:Thiol-disulfide isomerase/thioredoxin n=1 Tax=Aeromicrobium panaciterrae TaxID=363861 RepID=A0ABU1UKH8_9ACTN|nr:TlpA disulfide reductase family protein [Aeromicrobium panaciterrae]MDR7085688.1 thiol-disulfide isomerase/thioredoxin [Aeromicrobium panaciterrae]
MKRVIVVALLLALAGCTSAPSGEKPTFGGGSAPAVDESALATAKAAAGIEECPASNAPVPDKKALPDTTLDCLGGGKRVNLSGVAGTPTVINLWASWCEPCRKELPLLAKADKQYGSALRVLGVDFDDPAPDDAIELLKVSGVTYPQLVDRDSAIRTSLAVVGLPQTVFVDAQGRMVATERTPFRSYAELTAAIKQHLGVTP